MTAAGRNSCTEPEQPLSHKPSSQHLHTLRHRAPGAATGVYALECAMDELAVALKLDPIELRLNAIRTRPE